MARYSKAILTVIILLHFCTLAKAQSNNYAVFFTDKANSPYSVDQPEAFLSPRALDRRVKNQIAVTEEDLPVNQSYIQGVEGIGNVSVRQTTKWLNGALVWATATEIESVKQLPYVDRVEYIAPANVGGRIDRKQKKLEVEEVTAASDTLFQFDVLGIAEMRNDGYQGENMLIAVMDGGFSGMNSITAFSDLFAGGRVKMTYDFITRTADVYRYSDHGTKVMSLLAARQASPEFVGIVPNADYLLFVTEDVAFEYRVEEYRWLVAAEKADSAGADVISSSLGYNYFDDPTMDYTVDQLDGTTALITRAAELAAAKGILVVTSGGNTGILSAWETVVPPADLITGLAIGSITSTYSLSNFSPRGATTDGRIKPDLLALGSATYVINQAGIIVNSSGTSFSAPQVAGLAAGVLQAHPELTVAEILLAFYTSSSNAASPDSEYGYGIPSYRALKNYLLAEAADTWYAAYPNPLEMTNYLHIKVFDPTTDNTVKISVFDTFGRALQEYSATITWGSNEYFLEMTGLPRGIYIVNLQSNSNFSQFKILKL